MPILALSALILAAAQLGGDEQWYETGRDDDQIAAIDLASIAGEGRVRTAWTRAEYQVPRDGNVVFDLYQNEYDCEDRTFTLIAWRRLDAAGAETDIGIVPPEERRTDAIVDGSIGADELDLICTGGTGAEAPLNIA